MGIGKSGANPPGRKETAVAATGHLIATKVLSRDDAGRPQDRVDLIALLRSAQDDDIRCARSLFERIRERSYHRGRDLAAELEAILGEIGRREA